MCLQNGGVFILRKFIERAAIFSNEIRNVSISVSVNLGMSLIAFSTLKAGGPSLLAAAGGV